LRFLHDQIDGIGVDFHAVFLKGIREGAPDILMRQGTDAGILKEPFRIGFGLAGCNEKLRKVASERSAVGYPDFWIDVEREFDILIFDGPAKTRSAACWPLLSHWNR
jgi:hypothetical protein